MKKALSFLIFNIIIQLSSPLLFSQIKGNYLLHNYLAKEFKGHQQSWCATQDKRGVMYFGSSECIMEYDGVNWKKIFTSNNSVVRSLAVDEKATVWVGGYGDFGYLEPDISGKQSFVSLTGLLEKEDMNFADVWETVVTTGCTYFCTRTKLFRYNYKTKNITVWEPEFLFNTGFTMSGKENSFFISDGTDNKNKILRMKNDSLQIWFYWNLCEWQVQFTTKNNRHLSN